MIEEAKDKVNSKENLSIIKDTKSKTSKTVSRAGSKKVGAIGKAADVNIRLEKLEKYMDERFNWNKTPTEKTTPRKKEKSVERSPTNAKYTRKNTLISQNTPLPNLMKNRKK